jgi:microcystin degradation protein MlrC
MKRVLIGGILHETNTFNPHKTDIENFRTKELLYGDEIIAKRRNTNSETGGFIKGLESAGIEILPTVLASATPSGIVTKKAIETFTDIIIYCLEKNRVDGILLSLHGAMVVEEYIDGEGYIIEKIRSKIGFDIPITVTLDLHAVLTEKIAKNVDVIVIYRTYPHIDMAERGSEAANIMNGILEKKFSPVVAISKQPLLIGPPLNVLPVDFPMQLIMERARQIEKDTPGVIGICPAHGFMQQDVDFSGTGVAVTTDNDRDLARKIADEIGNMIFGYRHDF